MADVTGTLRHSFGGKEYSMRLTWGVLSALQEKHGDDFLSRLEVAEGKMPPFGLMIDIVAKALVKGERIENAEAHELADDMLTAEPELVSRLLAAAFPDAVGNGEARGRKKG